MGSISEKYQPSVSSTFRRTRPLSLSSSLVSSPNSLFCWFPYYDEFVMCNDLNFFFLLTGTGSQILVYDLVSGEIMKSFQVFEGIRVHGISLDKFHKQLAGSDPSFRIAIYGERRVKLLSFRIELDTLKRSFKEFELTLIHSLPKFGHWVLDVCFLKV